MVYLRGQKGQESERLPTAALEGKHKDDKCLVLGEMLESLALERGTSDRKNARCGGGVC